PSHGPQRSRERSTVTAFPPSGGRHEPLARPDGSMLAPPLGPCPCPSGSAPPRRLAGACRPRYSGRGARSLRVRLPRRPMASARIGALLARESITSTQQLRDAQVDQHRTGKRLAYSLAQLGILGERELTEFLSRQYG